jgi:hypothetical protein
MPDDIELWCTAPPTIPVRYSTAKVHCHDARTCCPPPTPTTTPSALLSPVQLNRPAPPLRYCGHPSRGGLTASALRLFRRLAAGLEQCAKSLRLLVEAGLAGCLSGPWSVRITCKYIQRETRNGREADRETRKAEWQRGPEAEQEEDVGSDSKTGLRERHSRCGGMPRSPRRLRRGAPAAAVLLAQKIRPAGEPGELLPSIPCSAGICPSVTGCRLAPSAAGRPVDPARAGRFAPRRQGDCVL